MGVIYKLKEEVVHFIISERNNNPLASCRQLAGSASIKFGLNISKSSVYDVLKESGIMMARGRKPKDKFEIPQEKKKQIQSNLAQVKLLPLQAVTESPPDVILSETKDLKKKMEISPVYEGAGKIFLKAARYDLGIYSDEEPKDMDKAYYLTYCKGIRVSLENNREFFIDLPIPIERCIREAADGLVNNIRPFMANRISDQKLFEGAMRAENGLKMTLIAIVDQNNHILSEFSNIVERNRSFMIENRYFVDSNEIVATERSKILFFSPNDLYDIEYICNLKGFDAIKNDIIFITLLLPKDYDRTTQLENAAKKLNAMCLQDERSRQVQVKIEKAIG